MKIAHLSDIHFGKIAHEEIVDALITEVNQANVTLVVVSGDLTQRARRSEYRAAADMLSAFEPPTLVVPGNHDVYAWWRPVARLMRPLRRYREYISDEAAPTFVADGLAVLGINSAHGRTIKGGRIGSNERATVSEFFEGQADERFKVLVVHHHLTKIQALGPHDVARQAQKALDVASEVGVDLILCGHLHISHIEPVEIIPNEHRIVIASAGTATSSRGRRSNRKTNFYNVVGVGSDHFTIEERRFDPDRGAFIRDCVTRFDR